MKTAILFPLTSLFFALSFSSQEKEDGNNATPQPTPSHNTISYEKVTETLSAIHQINNTSGLNSAAKNNK